MTLTVKLTLSVTPTITYPNLNPRINPNSNWYINGPGSVGSGTDSPGSVVTIIILIIITRALTYAKR